MAELSLGQLAKSRAGRDKGKFMIVMKVLDSEYVLVVDGKLRKVENPKKKKLKHLQLLNKKAESIADKLESNRRISNDEVRRALKQLVETESQEDNSYQK